MNRLDLFLWFWILAISAMVLYFVGSWVKDLVQEWLARRKRRQREKERRKKTKEWKEKRRKHLERAKKHNVNRSAPSDQEDYERDLDKGSIRGKIMNKLGISYEKPEREESEEKGGGEGGDLDEKGGVSREDRLRKKWEWVISELEESGEVKVGKNQHYGGLRGNDIILRAYSDLKRLGYEDLEKELNENESYLRLGD